LSQNVDEFLAECRTLINARKVDLFLNDPDNKNTVNLLAYSQSNVLQELQELTSSDLFEGPVPDNNSKYPGEVFIFKKQVRDLYLYIKLKIRDVRGQKEVFLMSFHPDRP
jgi:hypothetical protein